MEDQYKNFQLKNRQDEIFQVGYHTVYVGIREQG